MYYFGDNARTAVSEEETLADCRRSRRNAKTQLPATLSLPQGIEPGELHGGEDSGDRPSQGKEIAGQK
ncbi:hypothetical protein HDU67_000692, partial [Dinochytrium kinnereticum]